MGMAASQARFLNLTARKSNVEYQGQQVNQARTVLANESANLYNEMANLTVPTPPIQTDFSKMGYALTDINNNQVIIEDWNVNPNYVETAAAGTPESYKYIADIQYQKQTKNLNKTSATINSYNSATGTLNSVQPADSKSESFNEILKQYNEKNNVNYNANDFVFIMPDNTNNAATVGQNAYYALKSELAAGAQHDVALYSLSLNYDDVKAQMYANFTSPSSAGRFSQVDFGKMITHDTNQNEIVIDDNNGLKGNHTLGLANLYDDSEYEQSYQDYLYQKDLYEKKVQELNAKTAKIQQQDKTLELKLKQLDTEQEALTQEMEAVKAVIQKNVEKTFNTFG